MNAHVHKTCLNSLSLALTSWAPQRGRPHPLHRIGFDLFHNIDLNRTSPDCRRFYLAPTTWNLFGSKGLLCWNQLRNCYIKVILTVASYLLYRYDISISPKCRATTLKHNSQSVSQSVRVIETCEVQCRKWWLEKYPVSIMYEHKSGENNIFSSSWI